MFFSSSQVVFKKKTQKLLLQLSSFDIVVEILQWHLCLNKVLGNDFSTELT